MDSRFLVPIFLANITLGKFKKQGKNDTPTSTVVLENKVVKGFTPKDIVKRRTSQFIKQAGKCGKTEEFRVLNIELLSQHGCGVND